MIDLSEIQASILAVCPINGLVYGGPNSEGDGGERSILFSAEATPTQRANAQALFDAWDAATGEVPAQVLGPISAATLGINSGEVLGIETSVNFSFGFMIDTDKYWVFFTKPEPDTNYLVLGNVPFVRNTEYVEITAPDLSEVSLTTWRVS